MSIFEDRLQWPSGQWDADGTRRPRAITQGVWRSGRMRELLTRSALAMGRTENDDAVQVTGNRARHGPAMVKASIN